MDAFIDERDHKLLDRDRYTFFVLNRIIDGKCKYLSSDHERLIICHSDDPFPVWIWTPDKADEKDMERAYLTAREGSFLDGDHRINMKYELAGYFMDRAAKDGGKLGISMNMFAYDCREPIVPHKQADGELYRCEMEDLDEVTEFIEMFHSELDLDRKDTESYREDAKTYIETGNMYLWKTESGLSAASCKYGYKDALASLNLVYTRPEYRRKHYAENLVYGVTMKAKEAGFLPMLYTDADYAASNACYEKIGYVLRGKLCTIG